MWFFNLPSAKKLIFSLKFDQFDPFSPNDSEFLSRVGALPRTLREFRFSEFARKSNFFSLIL